MKLFGKRKPPAGSSSTGVNLERKSGGPKLDRGSVSFSDKGDSDPSGAPRGSYRSRDSMDYRYAAVPSFAGGHADSDDTILEAVKHDLRAQWAPEYQVEEFKPPSDNIDTVSERATTVSLPLCLEEKKYMRKTKILCTMGPKCWSEEMIDQLMDAGMDIARLNFSHGDHEGQGAVFDRFKKVAAQRGAHAAILLDTKGPEIRTAMLKDHKPIALEAGQPIIVEAVGDRYTEFEGYKTAEETRIGLSYAKLCSSVHPGNMILLADGSLSIRVEEILNDTELRGTVMNSKSLGERKNCNLPGVKVDIPVLTEKDINDLQNFCCKYKMDFVAASFVQSKEDVEFIRRVLDEAGGQNVKIISKIENQEGLKNYDDILLISDGIMVARGDLGMEIPPEKVTLAQKYMITRANITARFVICATQMLESMVDNYSPTRAEMTDVANAVFDGVDAVMLSGETANGAFPAQAVDTMARICRSAEIGVNYYQAYDFIRNFTAKPLGTVEAVVSTLAKTSNDINPGMIVMFSEGGKCARIVAKYRPSVPVLVVTSNKELARSVQIMFGLYTMILDKPVSSMTVMKDAVHDAIIYGKNAGLCVAGKEVVVLFSSTVTSAPDSSANRHMYITRCPGNLMRGALGKMSPTDHDAAKTLSMRSTVVDLPMLFESSTPPRKTKIIATLGPQCSSEGMIEKMIDAGMDVARINMVFWKGDEIKPIAELIRKVAARKNKTVAILVDTRGPEIRTCYLVDGPETRQPVDTISLEQGQTVLLTAHDPTGTEPFEGWKTATETRIPVSYPDLAVQVTPGTTVLINDGDIRLEVTEVLNSEVKAKVLNDAKLRSWTSINLLGIRLNLPILTNRDRRDLQLAIDAEVDIVAASFVRNKDDLEYIKDLLIDEGGADMKVVAKIETIEALENLDEILEEADGVMVARGDLGAHITPEKVFLAQNMITTKATIQGKFTILARHCLQSMVSNPRPTRAEMTDVANAVLDGVHCIMLSAETAIGNFPVESVSTTAAIARNAEAATNYTIQHNFIRDVTAKPFSTEEGVAAAAAKSPLDRSVQLVVVISETGKIANLLAKFKPSVPIVLVTTDPKVAGWAKIMFAMYPCLVDFLGDRRDLPGLIKQATTYAKSSGIYSGGSITVVHGANEPDTEIEPVMQLWSASTVAKMMA